MKYLVALSAAGLVEAKPTNNAMRKVITLLKQMKSTVEGETVQGRKDAAEYADWCIAAITETEADIKYGTQKVEELAAAAEDGAARSAAAKAEAAECGMAIGKSQAQQAKAETARKAEHHTFVSKEAELVEADTMLGKAYSVLKRSLSLMQTGQMSPKSIYAEEVVAALGQIIESAIIDTKTSEKISSFLEDADSLKMGNPQIISKNYQSKSGAILETIQQMQEKNAQILSKLRQREMESRHSYELLMQDLTNTEENKGEQMAAAKETGAKAEASGKQAEASGAEAADVLTADKKELRETQQGCDRAAKTWAAREADAANEVAVISQAIDILSGKFGGDEAFLQVKSNGGEDERDFARRQKAAEVLRKLGREYNQFSLMQAAQAAQDDTFAKVRGMISELVARLEEEQRAEASKEAKCRADTAKGEKDLKIKKAQFDKLTSRSEGAAAHFLRLGEEINDLNEQLKQLAADVQAATSFRAKDKKDNAAVVKDAEESIASISGAISTLSEYYGTGEATSFVQISQPKTDSATVIIEMLQTAQEDFEKLKQETEAAESSAQDAYDKQMQDAEVSKTKKTAMVQGKTAEKASVKVQQAQIAEDLADADKALTAANDFLRGTKERCANKAMSFEERQQRREAEIAGLREALEILSSDEAFIQTSQFMARTK